MAKKFKPHMMYKKCKEVMAETFKDHLKLKKKGYGHEKDKSCETTKQLWRKEVVNIVAL